MAKQEIVRKLEIVQKLVEISTKLKGHDQVESEPDGWTHVDQHAMV